MRFLARRNTRRIEQPLDLPVQSPQHADPRVHQEIAALGCADQAGNGGLPLRRGLVRLRQFHYVVGGVLQRHKRLPLRRIDWIVEGGRHRDIALSARSLTPQCGVALSGVPPNISVPFPAILLS
jgi:hypothetical protein